MKRFLKAASLVPLTLASAYARTLARRWPSVGLTWSDQAYVQARDRTAHVVHPHPAGNVEMTFYVPNEVCRYRAETFSTKEPETLEWLDRFGGAGALYDIGANVGIYSVYYAKTHSGRVYAFEPSALNLGLLARNLSVNEVSSQVAIVPNPLTSENQVASFHLTMLDEGGAMSTFGEELGHDGGQVVAQMNYDTTGMTLDFLVESGVVPEPPTMMKIDVDGIEHLILRGARSTLQLPSLQTILIEVNDAYAVLASEVAEILTNAGFMLTERRHAAMFDDGEFASSFNQIWVRQA